MKRQRDVRKTRESLMAAATELFAIHGYDGTTVERIARRAGANKAMISYHFGGKKKLYLAIMLESFSAARSEMQAVREAGPPAEQRLREFIRRFRKFVQEHPQFPAIMAREAVEGGRHLDQRILPELVGIYGMVREVIEEGVREGSFRPCDPILVHIGLIGSLVFFFSTEPFRKRLFAARAASHMRTDPDEFVRSLEETLIRGLAVRPRSGSMVVCETPTPPRSRHDRSKS